MTAGAPTPEIIRIDEHSGQAEALQLDAARLAPDSAMPAQTVRNLFTDASGRFFSGIWSSTRGAWRVAYTENELCVLTQGSVRITDESGRSWTFGARRLLRRARGIRGPVGSARGRTQVLRDLRAARRRTLKQRTTIESSAPHRRVAPLRCRSNRTAAARIRVFRCWHETCTWFCKTGFRVPSATICATAATFPWFPRNLRGTQ